MSVGTYRKKPVTIEAMQWTGDNNWQEVQDWCGDHVLRRPEGTLRLFVNANSAWLDMQAGEWIARDRHGFYPIKSDVFHESYEPI